MTTICIQNVSNARGTAVQAYNDHQQSSPAPKMSLAKVTTTPLMKNGQMTTRLPSSAAPAQPSLKNEPSPFMQPRTPTFISKQVVLPPPVYPNAAMSSMTPLLTPRAMSPSKKPVACVSCPSALVYLHDNDNGHQRQHSATKMVPQCNEFPLFSRKARMTMREPSPSPHSPSTPMKKPVPPGLPQISHK